MSSQKRNRTKIYSLPVIKDEVRKDESAARRHPLVLNTELKNMYSTQVQNLYTHYMRTSRRTPNNRFLGTKVTAPDGSVSYTWKTYGDTQMAIVNLGSGLYQLGLRPKAPLGIFAKNCYEWIVSEYACYYINAVTVPLYDTLGVSSILHICKQTELEIIVVSIDQLPLIFSIKNELPLLRTIILVGQIADSTIEEAKKHDLTIHSFSGVIKSGLQNHHDPEISEPNDVFTICYTSGATGVPKGVVLTHQNMLSTVGGLAMLIKNDYLVNMTDDDIHLSYLPLAHVFERCICATVIYFGGAIGFYGGNTTKIMEDIQTLRPTIFCSVPRLFSKIILTIKKKMDSKSKILSMLAQYGYDQKWKKLQTKGDFNHWLWDPLVFNNIKMSFGGRIRVMISGSAPLDPQTLHFIRICFACEVYEGYGQTETCGACMVNEKYDWTANHIGVPIPSIEYKLVSCPELGYDANDEAMPCGELLLRGNSMFKEYYKDEEKTKETILPNGWIRTGDIAKVDPQGRLSIVDRKKSLFKLAQGEYISPEKVEGILMRHPAIEQIFLHGDSLKSSAIAVILPFVEYATEWAIHSGKMTKEQCNEMTSDDLRKHIVETYRQELSTTILNDIVKFSRSEDLKGFEIPRSIYLIYEPFSIDNNQLTTTFKLRRHNIVDTYLTQINEVYAKLES